MNYLKTLMLIVSVAVSNVSASTSLEELIGNMHLSSGWVARAKAILPQIQNAEALQISVELQQDIQIMLAIIDHNPRGTLDAMVNWFSAFEESAPDSEGAYFRRAVLSIFHSAA